MTANNFTLLFIDDEPDIVSSLNRSFRRDHNVLTATSGNEGIRIINSQHVDLIISDQRMPDVTGDKVLQVAKLKQPDAIRMLLTGYSDIEALMSCINEASIYKYITKPWEPEDLKLTVQRALESVALKRNLKAKSDELDQAYQDAVTMLSVACEGKDEDTGHHVQRVQHYTEALALKLGIDVDEAKHMGIMSILHDAGKLFVPDEILKKTSSLTDEEWDVMKKHPEFGARILGTNPFYEVAREIAYGHHENYDGSGYPLGIAADDIPLPARIAKVADAFDALSSKRSYKAPWPLEKTLALLTQEAGSAFDPEVIQGFMALYEDGVITQIMKTYHADNPSVFSESGKEAKVA